MILTGLAGCEPKLGHATMTIRVYGLPVSQGRPRAFLPKGATRPRMYDPSESRDWKRTVQAQAVAQRPLVRLEGPLRLDVVFYLPRPASAPRRVTLPVKRPDLDNLVKAIKDALRAIVWRDDSQVVVLWARKEFATDDHPPGVRITVQTVKGGDETHAQEAETEAEAAEGAGEPVLGA